MAKAAWLTVEPSSGIGNASVQNKGTVHTGRESRQTTVTGVAVGVSPNKTYQVVQNGKNEFVSFTNGASISVSKTGGNLTISGKSNSKKLTFAMVSVTPGENQGVLTLTLPASYQANGTTTNNATNITGDPGAEQEYNFNITFTGIPANGTIKELLSAMKVTADGGQTAQISIVQTAGDPVFSFGSTTITLEANGNAVSQEIISNTSWTLS